MTTPDWDEELRKLATTRHCIGNAKERLAAIRAADVIEVVDPDKPTVHQLLYYPVGPPTTPATILTFDWPRTQKEARALAAQIMREKGACFYDDRMHPLERPKPTEPDELS